MVLRPTSLPWLATVLLAAAGCGTRTAVDDRLSEAANVEPPGIFRMVSPDCGIDATYRNGEEANRYAILETLGGGIGLIDYDGDGLLDVFVPGGGYFEGQEIRGHPCKLYKNLGNFQFRDVTTEVGLVGPWFYSHGCAVADYDCDGWPDLLVTGWHRVALYHNEPVDPADPKRGRKLVDVTRQVGLDLQVWTSSAGFADLDGDGFPDLYLCCYTDWSFAKNPPCFYDTRMPDVCPPNKFAGLPHFVFHNRAGKSFVDVSKEAGLKPANDSASKGLGVLLVDLNGDGKPEVYVANDTVPKFLYLNVSTPGQIRLEEMGLASGASLDDHGAANGSMGLDAADFDGRGLPGLWVTNYENEAHALYRNEGRKPKPFFSHRSAASGIGLLGRANVGWGTGFLDFDRDGWEDIIVSHGHAVRLPRGSESNRAQRPALLHNRGDGRFEDYASRGGSYFTMEHNGRGLALGDLDNDGKIDCVVSRINRPVVVLRNESTDEHHWIGIELQRARHADCVGAKVVIQAGGRKQTRFAKGGGSYASSSDRRLHFGVGAAASVNDVTVAWPDGKVERWPALATDRYHRLEQGKSGP